MSAHPFPNRAATSKLDSFQAQALAALEKDPKTPVHSVETVNGRPSVRYAVADVMKEGCVACHNSHPESPKKDWKVGDVRGLVEVVVPVDDVEHSMSQSALMLGGVIVASFGLLGLVLHLLMQRVVSRPLQQWDRPNLQVAMDRGATIQPSITSAISQGLARAWGTMLVSP